MSFQHDVLPRAVGRVRVRAKEGVLQGTGFLVGPRRLITCAHCLGDSAVGTVEFSEVADSAPVAFHRIFQRLDQERGIDVAVVELERPVAGTVTLPLAHAGVALNGLDWRSFGHPKAIDGLPLWLSGTVDGAITRGTGDDRGSLVSLHISGELAALVGFSGAPVLTDHGVVGIFSYQLYAMQQGTAGVAAAPAFSKGFAVPTALLQTVPDFSDSVARSAKVFVAYRHGSPEEPLLEALRTAIRSERHEPLADRDLVPGEVWTERLVNMLDEADVFVPILTERSVESPVLLQELRLAYRRRRRTGRPVLLPIRDPAMEDLPYEFDTYVGSLQYVPWRGGQDTPSAVEAVVRAIGMQAPLGAPPATAPSIPPTPAAYVHIRPSASALRDTDLFYIERSADKRLYARAEADRGVVTLRAPSGFGKSSLALRLKRRLNGKGRNVALIDFEGFGRLPEDDGGRLGYVTFLNDFAQVLCGRFGVEAPAQPVQHAVKVQELLRRAVEQKPNSVLILDGMHRLMARGYAEDFFSACRSWAEDSDTTLNFVLCIALKPDTLMVDPNRSPFNIDPEPLELSPFKLSEVAELAWRTGAGLAANEVETLYEVTGGHPAMVRQGLAFLLSNSDEDGARPSRAQIESRSKQLEHNAGDSENGPFAANLRGLMTKLEAAAKRAPGKPRPDSVLMKIIDSQALLDDDKPIATLLEMFGAVRSDSVPLPTTPLTALLDRGLEALGLHRAASPRRRFRPFNLAIAQKFGPAAR